MKTLHIIKKTEDAMAWDTVLRQREKAADTVAVLLLHDAVFTPCPGEGAGIFACRDDVAARGVKTSAALVGYEEVVRLIFDADSVVCW